MIREIPIKAPDGVEIIFGQGTFSIFSIEEIFRAIKIAAPNVQFGAAFSEGSGSRTIYTTGNDQNLRNEVAENLLNINAGHTFLIFLHGVFPMQILPNIKALPTVLRIFAATGNPTIALLYDTGDQAGVVGVADGFRPTKIEEESDIPKRKELIKKIGYSE